VTPGGTYPERPGYHGIELMPGSEELFPHGTTTHYNPPPHFGGIAGMPEGVGQPGGWHEVTSGGHNLTPEPRGEGGGPRGNIGSGGTSSGSATNVGGEGGGRLGPAAGSSGISEDVHRRLPPGIRLAGPQPQCQHWMYAFVNGAPRGNIRHAGVGFHYQQVVNALASRGVSPQFFTFTNSTGTYLFAYEIVNGVPCIKLCVDGLRTVTQ
jgi:hypothetical protein